MASLSVAGWTFLWVLACLAGARGESRARLVDNGYEGVVVAISQDVKEEDGPAIVDSLKEVISETSRRLYRATHRRAYFRNVTILVPREWSSVNLTGTARGENFQDSDIRVDLMSSIYRHQPYTVQNGGCGDPGLYIHLTPTYLMDSSEAAWFGPRGKALLLEWAKFRWGVFDELGYPDDPAFPLFYASEEGRVLPNYCANHPVSGRQVDRRGRSGCGLTWRGEPDHDCRFIPYNNQEATSSLLSFPFILSDTVVYFCGGAGREHDSAAPTKQNLHCGGQAAWDVIAQHQDFSESANPPTDQFEEVAIQVVQQADANYALVLDYSGSMNDQHRINKLRKTARRWLLHEVATGSHVGILMFSQRVSQVHKLTRITNEASRLALADSLKTKADGGKNIGTGLYIAVKKILVNRTNPIILLITDGEENENPRISDVIEDVKESGARVITVAFGSEADPKLERIAHTTGGKAFTVNDQDEGQMLEDAFNGALTYQPPPPRSNSTITIYQEEYRGGGSEASGTFNVDFTVGRNMVVRLDTDTQAHLTSSQRHPRLSFPPILISPDGTQHTRPEFNRNTSTYTFHVPLAQQGEWQWRVGLSGAEDSFVQTKVTAQPRDPDIHPITTRAWVSSGAREVSASADRLIIYAEVMQGYNPVVDADVRAHVTPSNESEPAKVYYLLDNGQGADTQGGDGIYSRYLTQYSSSGQYSVKAEVTDGGRAVINKGFLTSPQRRRRSTNNSHKHAKQDIPKQPDLCCGSFIPVSKDAQKTGTFHRIFSGGSIYVTSVPEKEISAPAQVRDLRVHLLSVERGGHTLPTHASIALSWTAPGDDLDQGIVSEYELRMSHLRNDLVEKNFENSSSSVRIDLSEQPVLVESGLPIRFNLTLTLTNQITYFALQAVNNKGMRSKVSNIAHVMVEAYSTNTLDQRYSGVPVWALVVIVMGSLCLCLVVATLCLARKSKKYGKYES